MRSIFRVSAAILLLAISAAPSRAADETRTERVLVPLAVIGQTTPGAHGTRWTTRVFGVNSGEGPIGIRYFQSECLFIFCANGFTLGPGDVMTSDDLPRLVTAPESPGTILYVSSAAADSPGRLSGSVLVTEISGPNPVSARVPMVHERELFTDRLTLVGVPATETSRLMLRVYDPDQTSGAVSVRIRDACTGNEVDREVVWLQTSPLPEQPAGWHPNYAQRPYAGANLPGCGAVNIEIEPLTPDLRFWAFVTVTDDDTQQLQVFLPDPGDSCPE